MSKVENPEDDDLLNKNNGGGDDEDDIDEGDDEDEIDDIDESDDEDEIDDIDESDDEDGDDEDEDDADDADEDDDKKKSKKDNARAKLNAQNRFLKKEGYEFVNGKWVKPAPNAKKKNASSKSDQLSTSDVFVLVKANVPEEDIPEVQAYAKMKGITIKEALKSNVVQTILANNAEERETANATHTGTSKRSTGKKSSEDVLADAKRGTLPDDPAELAKARARQRQAKKKK